MNAQIPPINANLQNAASFINNSTQNEIELAKKLLTEGKNVNYVVTVTGLTQEKVQALQLYIGTSN